jgi:hypothetical protein
MPIAETSFLHSPWVVSECNMTDICWQIFFSLPHKKWICVTQELLTHLCFLACERKNIVFRDTPGSIPDYQIPCYIVCLFSENSQIVLISMQFPRNTTHNFLFHLYICLQFIVFNDILLISLKGEIPLGWEKECHPRFC